MFKLIRNLNKALLFFGFLILAEMVLIILSFVESKKQELSSFYTDQLIIRPPLLQIRLSDLNLSDNSITYNLLPVNTEQITKTITFEGNPIQYNPLLYLVITADINHNSSNKNSDLDERTIQIPIFKDSTNLLPSMIDISDGYQTKLPIRHYWSFFYPYDVVDISITTAVVNVDSSDITGCSRWSESNVGTELYFPTWSIQKIGYDMREHYFRCQLGEVLQDKDPGNIYIKLRRPWMYQVFTPLFLIISSGLVITFWHRKTKGDTWGFVTAMVFGLWSIRMILIPADVIGPTLFDIWSMTLYVAVFICVLIEIGGKQMN